jgi:two-component system sensor histidine kinase KdpD
VVVEVSDRGPASPRAETRAFEKFYRGAALGRAGVGLGLAICRAIVQVHGGTISAENRPGGGATIRFTLPRPSRPHCRT